MDRLILWRLVIEHAYAEAVPRRVQAGETTRPMPEWSIQILCYPVAPPVLSAENPTHIPSESC